MHVSLAPLHVVSAGTGAPLVLLHGWALHGGLFAPIVHAFANSHHVHVVDLPGHGYSADCDRIRVLGWSLGGAIAMHWAQRSPSRIERLLLVTATPKFVAAPDWPDAMEAATLERFADELRVAFGPTLSRFLTLQTRGGDAAHSVLAALRRDALARGEPDRASLDAALAVLRSIDLRETAQHLQQPALVIAGTHDTLVPLGAGEWLGRALPHGRVEVIQGAGHVPFLSHRDRFLRAALAFLDDD